MTNIADATRHLNQNQFENSERRSARAGETATTRFGQSEGEDTEDAGTEEAVDNEDAGGGEAAGDVTGSGAAR